MDFDLSEEQRLLKESIERLLGERYDFAKRTAMLASDGGWSREMWKRYAELGLLAVPFAEAHGGIGGGPVDTMVVMEAFGGALVLEPYLATVVLGGGFLRHGGSAAQQADLIPRIGAGELLLAFAHTERQARYDLFDVATTARRDGDHWVLDGA
jgi:alkylation response protein AidB-like acyl-CoA dehydrogenase